MEILILLAVIAGIILLGRYALTEGQRIESQKRFMKDMEDYDKNKENGKR